MTFSEQAATMTHAELLEACLALQEKNRIIHEQNQILGGRNQALQERNKTLQDQLEWFKRQVFGKKSEKLIAERCNAQLCLGSQYEPEDAPPPPSTTVKSYERECRKDGVVFAEEDSLLKFDQSVPVEVVQVENPAAKGLASDQYEVIGEEVTYRLAQRPGAAVVLKIVRPKIKVKETAQIITAPLPSTVTVIEQSVAEVSFLAGLVVDKFLYHLPLYRQHQRLTASGVYLSRMTLTNLVHHVAQLLEPIYRALQSSILQSSVIAMDETPNKAGRNEKKHKMKPGYFWAIYGELGELAFLFSPSRSGKIVREVLGGFEGVLLSDAYKVYESFANEQDAITRAQCWAHCRRKFFDAQGAEPERAAQALEFIRQLYEAEAEHKAAGRAFHAKPLVDDFFKWLCQVFQEQALLPSSPFTVAASYALKNEKALRVFLDNPKVPLDTNHVERDNRLNAMGRKNYMFHWTEVGAEYAAILYSLIATCRHQGIDPYTYFVDVLQRISTHPMRDIHLLSPRLWKEHFAADPLRSEIDRRQNAVG